MDQNEPPSDYLNISDQPSANAIDLLQKDYYDKFKAGQNLYEQSLTLSRMSIQEKTSDDYNNNTYLGMVNISERLTEEIYKNQVQIRITQLLENKVSQLSQELASSIEHTTILQQQSDSQCSMIQDLNTKLKKQIRNNEIEKLLNAQLLKKNLDLQEVNKYYLIQIRSCLKKLQMLPTERDSVRLSDSKTTNQGHLKSNQSICSSNRQKEKQAFTEDSTVKDSSCSEQKSQDNHRFAESAQQFYKTSSNFLSPNQQQSPKNLHFNLEKRIESTLASIRAMKMQFQQFNSK